MSWSSRDRRVYEARVVADSLVRLAKQLDLSALPFSDEELQTLARRARASLFASTEKKERLARYRAHLSGIYGEECVGVVWTALERINNQIGWEEK